jgi:hypothetical protein
LFKGGNGDGHREAPPWPKSSTAGLASCQGKLTEIEDERASAGLPERNTYKKL